MLRYGVVGAILCGADGVLVPRRAPDRLIIRIVLSESLLGDGEVVIGIQLACDFLAPQHFWQVAVVHLRAISCGWVLELQPILIAEFQLLLNLHSRVLFDVF